MINKPKGIKVDRPDRSVIVTWQDDHESKYGFSLLRYACPCAECRGHGNMGQEPPSEVFTMPSEDSERTRIENLEAVGSYAVTILWQDGHHYGIYNWDFLRALCPCDECRKG